MPWHEFIVGVTVIVAIIGVIVAFVAVKLGIFPVPLAANPIVVFEFVHTKLAPEGLLTKVVAETVVLLQTLLFEGTVTVGPRSIDTVTLLEAEHPADDVPVTV